MKRIAMNDPAATTLFWRTIRSGGLVAYPTDTLYGLGTDTFDQAAVRRLVQVKGRSGPFSVMVGSLKQLREYALVSPAIADKLSTMLPGPFTVILFPSNPDTIPALLKGPQNGVGFRIPEYPFIPRIYQRGNKPVISTSVNRTGQPPLQSPDEIQEQFGEVIDLLVDAGTLPSSRGSTVLDFTVEPYRIVRQGDGKL